MKYQFIWAFVIFSLFIVGNSLLTPTSYDLSSVVGLTTAEVIKVLA